MYEQIGLATMLKYKTENLFMLLQLSLCIMSSTSSRFTHSTFIVQAEEQNNMMSARVKSLKERQQGLTVAADVVEKVVILFLILSCLRFW